VTLRKFTVFLSFFTGFSIILYWALVYTGVTPTEELIPGYTYWAMSYPISDGWIAICAFLTGIFLLKKNDKAALFGLLAAGGLIFLALNATTYTFITGVLSKFTAGGIVMKLAMRVYFLAAGIFLAVFFGKGNRKDR